MLILAIDTSTVAASAAVMDENKLYGEIFTDLKLKHSEKLMFLVDDLLKNLRLSINDIDIFACGMGPGSFTGLRIASACIKGFAQPQNKKIIGVSSLEACAYNQYALENERIIPIFDAQQDSFYTAVFRKNHDKFDRMGADCVLKIDDFISVLNSSEEKNVLCGDGVIAHREYLKDSLGDKIAFAPSKDILPKASAVASLAFEKAQKNVFFTYEDFMPNYIRKSQAEVNYKAKI